MRIAIVCPYNFFIPGGVQEHVREQAKELRVRGHKVTIVTPKPRLHDQEAPEGVVFLGQSARLRTPSATSADVSASVEIDAINQFFAEHQFDLVHIHEPVVPFLPRQLITKSPSPVIGTFHAAPPENVVGKSFVNSLRPYVRSVAKLVDAITVVSPAAAEIIGVDKFDYHTIANGVELKAYHTVDKKRIDQRLLFVGRLEKRKGPDYLLMAFAQLQKQMPDVSLDIAGDGPLKAELQAYVKRHHLKNVKFHGFVSDETKRDLMATCDLFVAPALYGESFGIVLLEAMAMGAPVVAGDNPGYATVLKGRGAVSLVDPTDTAVFTQRLRLFLEDKDLVALWLKWASKTVKQYDWPKIVDQYEALYKQVCEKS